MANEQTSARVASLAAKGLADPASLKPQEIREVCASALNQAADREEAEVSEVEAEPFEAPVPGFLIQP